MPVPCRSLTEAATVSTPAIGAATAAAGRGCRASASAPSHCARTVRMVRHGPTRPDRRDPSVVAALGRLHSKLRRNTRPGRLRPTRGSSPEQSCVDRPRAGERAIVRTRQRRPPPQQCVVGVASPRVGTTASHLLPTQRQYSPESRDRSPVRHVRRLLGLVDRGLSLWPDCSDGHRRVLLTMVLVRV
jgi:hypothetical protein